MNATLQWFGTATWRLTVGDTVIWLDAYIDRNALAAPVPQRAAEITSGDFILIGHSHFDHIAEASLVAKNTGATVVGSALSCEIVQDEGLPPAKTITCAGGEELELAPVKVRPFRSLHGFNGLREWPDPAGRTREERMAEVQARDPELARAAAAHTANIPEKQRQDGGPLAYIVEWDGFRLFWHDTPGMVQASWEQAARYPADLAILAAAAGFSTPNIDGEPQHGGVVPFVTGMTQILKPGAVVLNHHDDWMPPVTFHLDEAQFAGPLSDAGSKLEIRKLGESFSLG
ncbi:MAG: MBL fold metallo-hydrolase [Dehalococcoidia bacterium]|nr:MBL fold metallo-hydrolase [Dehalococcoidia bacterium]